MKTSFWEQDTWLNNVDVVIIGSGIVGLCSAIHIQKSMPKAKILVLERGILPSGASTKNAGFACFGSCSELLDDLSNVSENEVFKTVEKRYKGLKKLRTLLGDKAIDYKNWGGFEVFDSIHKFEICADQMLYLNKKLKIITGEKEVFTPSNRKIKSFGLTNINRMIENKLEGQIDTGKMMRGLLIYSQQIGVNILSGIEIDKINDQGNTCVVTTTNGLELKSKKVLVATNGFAQKLLPDIDVNPARSQVLITQPIEGLKLKGTFHYDKGYVYFRNINNRILLGGGRNLNFKKENTLSQEQQPKYRII